MHPGAPKYAWVPAETLCVHPYAQAHGAAAGQRPVCGQSGSPTQRTEGACTEATGQHRTVWKRGTRWPSGHKIQTARYLRTSSLKAVYQETPKSVLQDRCGRCVREHISVQAAWQVMAAETVISTGRGATQSSPVLCRGTARWPPCVPGSEWQAALMCAAECARLAAGLRGKTERQPLFLLPG